MEHERYERNEGQGCRRSRQTRLAGGGLAPGSSSRSLGPSACASWRARRPESEHLLSAFPRYRRSWPDHDPRHLYPAAPAAAPASPRGRDSCGAQRPSADDAVRAGPGKGRRVCRETVRLFFDFVESNPAAFIVGVRELHGASPVLRGALRQIMDEFAEDMSEDIIEFRLLPAVSEATIRRPPARSAASCFSCRWTISASRSGVGKSAPWVRNRYCCCSPAPRSRR